jgi:flagellin-like protein
MKGITPVIAVILLLLITVAMVGFAFVWFSRVTTMTTTATQTQIENQLTMQAKRVAIENIDKASNVVTVRNIGSQSISNVDLALYVGGAKLSCLAGVKDWPASITPGSTGSCDWSDGPACTSDTVIKVTAPGNFDESMCP